MFGEFEHAYLIKDLPNTSFVKEDFESGVTLFKNGMINENEFSTLHYFTFIVETVIASQVKSIRPLKECCK